MKFKITESANLNNPEIVIQFIKENCKPYLLAKGNYNGQLFRGQYDIDKNFFIGKVRKNREPERTELQLHFLLDKAFLKIFGWKARSQGLFVSGDWGTAATYGDPYVIFPIGEFKFVWSPDYADLYTVPILTGELTDDDPAVKKWKKANKKGRYEILKQRPDILENFLKYDYTNKNLIKAIKSNNEIAVACEKYIAIKVIESYDNKQKYSEYII